MEVSGRESRGRGTESRRLTAPVATPRVTRGRGNRWDRSDGGQRPVHQVGEDVTTERAAAGSLQMEPRARLHDGQGAEGSLWRKREGSFICSFIHSLHASWVPTVFHGTSRVRCRDYTEPPPTPSHSVALTSHCWRQVLAEVLRGGYNIREGHEGRPGYRPGKGMEGWPAICDGCGEVKEAESNWPGGEA